MCSIPLREQLHLYWREAVTHPSTDTYNVRTCWGPSGCQGGMAVREEGREGYKGEKASFPGLDRLNT